MKEQPCTVGSTNSIYDDIIILYGSQRLRVAKAAKKFQEILSERLRTRYGSLDESPCRTEDDASIG
jgi:hypothetical protein